jgi:hypothetical protein
MRTLALGGGHPGDQRRRRPAWPARCRPWGPKRPSSRSSAAIQVVDGALSKRVHRGLDARVARDQHDLGGVGGLEPGEEVEPAAVGQAKVDEQDVGRARLDLLAGFLQGAGGDHREALAPDELRQPEQEPGVVVDDQRERRGRRLRSWPGRRDARCIHVTEPCRFYRINVEIAASRWAGSTGLGM